MNVRAMAGTALWIAAIALLPLAWLAWQPSYVHRSALDPAEPIYASNHLQARGYVFPWLITEVPPTVGPVSFWARVIPGNLVLLYVIALCPVVLCWILVAAVRRWWRGFRNAKALL
jgi:hypothetical protein